MLLERTIAQLNTGPMPRARALELARMGYMQWLGGLPGQADYRKAAMHAHAMAAPFRRGAPAIAAFCDLLVESTRMPPVPLDLSLPARRRRGGARARRAEP
ncbi:MAG: hypothetical protein JJU42_12110 [Rhodobacteraceae bacterium]|nr:hypothetical protein [Paracoccaceae bacterium]